MRFLHCSDVHVTNDYFNGPILSLGWRRWIALLELRFGGRSNDFAQAGATLAGIASDGTKHQVDHLIVSGDLTAYSMEEEFAGAHRALAPWVNDPRRCSIIPGNHDTYTAKATREKRFEKHFGHLLKSDLPEYCREGAYPFVRLVGENSAVVGLCSARLNPMPGLSYGRVGKAQLEALEALLSDKRMQHRAVLVAVHHAPFKANGQPDKRTHGLLDAPELLQRLRGPRFAVLHGHIHHRFHHEASADRPHVLGAGSSTQRGREGYWLIDVKEGEFTGFFKTTPSGIHPPTSA